MVPSASSESLNIDVPASRPCIIYERSTDIFPADVGSGQMERCVDAMVVHGEEER